MNYYLSKRTSGLYMLTAKGIAHMWTGNKWILCKVINKIDLLKTEDFMLLN